MSLPPKPRYVSKAELEAEEAELSLQRTKGLRNKNGTEVSRRTKIIIGISAFILIFSLIVVEILWFKAAQGPRTITLSPGNVEATLLSLI